MTASTAFVRSRFHVLGTRVDPCSLQEAIAAVDEWIRTGRRGKFVALTNVNNVMEAKRDPRFQVVMNATDLSLPDGMPLAWLSKLRGNRSATRVAGPDFVLAFCKATSEQRYRHFFYGGDLGVAEKMAHRLKQIAPGMQIAGTYSPPFRRLTTQEDEHVVSMINAAGAHVLWVGLGCPKQESWIFEHRERLNVPVMAGVGQAFDIHAGVLRRAPFWMRNSGLEWLYRLASEPRRLWRRYLVCNTQFVYYLITEYPERLAKMKRAG